MKAVLRGGEAEDKLYATEDDQQRSIGHVENIGGLEHDTQKCVPHDMSKK